jgi:hypothetical protein
MGDHKGEEDMHMKALVLMEYNPRSRSRKDWRTGTRTITIGMGT